MNTIVIKLEQDTATPEIRRVLATCQPARLGKIIGPKVSVLTQNRLTKVRNTRNWPSSGLGEKMRRSTRWEATDSGAQVIVNRVEARQLYLGGVIKAGPKGLTIPARAEFYGRSAREFSNLKMVKFKSGTFALIITDKKNTAASTAKGKGVRVKGNPVGQEAGLVAYWWLPPGSSTRPQAGRPDIIPTDAEYSETAIGAIGEAIAGGRG